MIRIPDTKLIAIRTMQDDISAYKADFKDRLKEYEDGNNPEITEEYLADYEKSIKETDELYWGYIKVMMDELVSFRYGQTVEVWDKDNTHRLTIAVFKQAYVSPKDGYIYFNTDKSAKKIYDNKSCAITPHYGH